MKKVFDFFKLLLGAKKIYCIWKKEAGEKKKMFSRCPTEEDCNIFIDQMNKDNAEKTEWWYEEEIVFI